MLAHQGQPLLMHRISISLLPSRRPFPLIEANWNREPPSRQAFAPVTGIWENTDAVACCCWAFGGFAAFVAGAAFPGVVFVAATAANTEAAADLARVLQESQAGSSIPACLVKGALICCVSAEVVLLVLRRLFEPIRRSIEKDS